MHVLESIRQTFYQTIVSESGIMAEQCPPISFDFNVDEQKQQFGDISTNAAMIVAKLAKKVPREVAQSLIEQFKHDAVAKIEIAGPGFMNFFLTQEAFNQMVHDLGMQGEAFFKAEHGTLRKNYDIEFVSANPTGPLHIGHGRGAIIGDVLGNVLEFLGHTVVREYYINDAGNQIAKLGVSLKVRCQQISGLDSALPEDGYAGVYMLELARQCVQEYGVAVLGEQELFFQKYAVDHLLADIQYTLARYGVEYDIWFSEKTLHTDGSIERAFTLLREQGYLFEEDGADWFRSTAFGDDKDRVMRKASGEYTYVAADAAYLKNKVDRGFDVLVMTLGHDHHGYVERLQGLRQAFGYESVCLETILYQLVNMKSGGEQVRMSKRAGTMVTLADVIDTVGVDVARFFYLHKRAESSLEFDLELALKKTEENPVYYVHYAYVRTQSILSRADTHAELHAVTVHDAVYLGEAERLLIKKIVSLKELLAAIGHHHQTHLLAQYAIDLATTFHRYYALHRVIDPMQINATRARLLLVKTLGDTFALVFQLLRISQPRSM